MSPAPTTIALIPSARPSSRRGNASVTSAAELAIRNAPPTPWTSRATTSRKAVGASAQATEASGEQGEARRVRAGAADLVGDPAGVEHEDGRGQRVADDDPQQREQVGVEVAQDVGQGDDERSRGQRREQRADARDAEDDPAIAVARSRPRPRGCRGSRSCRGSGSGCLRVGDAASAASSSARCDADAGEAGLRPRRSSTPGEPPWPRAGATWRSTRSSASSEVDADARRIGRLAEALAVPFAGGLVLEQLADLGQREPGVVAQAADELEPVEVGRVVQPVVAFGAGGRLEQPDLLVVADRAGRQAGLGRDLVDPQEPLGELGVGAGDWALDIFPQTDTTTLTFT